jgi:competence protein ComEA
MVPGQPSSTTPVSKSERAGLLTAWTPSAQLATVFILGSVTALLAVQAYGYLAVGCRPAELSRAAADYRIDLNQADRAELLQLPGVGENLVDRINAYRQEHGELKRVEDLRAVRGVGPATVERIRNWVKGSEPPGDGSPGPAAAGSNGRSNKPPPPSSPIDICTATVEEFQKLPGIGPKLAQRIVDERSKRPFQSVFDLRHVNGIGDKKFSSIRPYVKVTSEPARPADVN